MSACNTVTTPCPGCGAGVTNEVGRHGRPRVWCTRDCYKAAQRPQATSDPTHCQGCGGELPVRTYGDGGTPRGRCSTSPSTRCGLRLVTS